MKVASGGGAGGGAGGGGFGGTGPGIKVLAAQADLEPAEIQDLGDIIPQLLEIKIKADTSLEFRVQVEFGNGDETLNPEAVSQISSLLEEHERRLQSSVASLEMPCHSFLCFLESVFHT